MSALIPHAIQRLSRVDWNFPRTGTQRGSVHSLHWFPGNFIPQIPAALIQILSSPGELVFDPFGGSGTTAVEALRLGRRVFSSDRMSACTMITRAKISSLKEGISRNHITSLLSKLTFEHQCRSEQSGLNGEGSSPDLSYWYASDTLAQLRYIWKEVESARLDADRYILTAIFSDVLFDCAAPGAATTSTGLRRRHHWGWIADNVRPRELLAHNAIKMFRERISGLDSAVRLESLPELNSFVVQQDARSLAIPNEIIDLVVTSPPYIGVIDYTHANRLLYTWMGWSMREEREHEIGARFRRMRRNAVSEYKVGMRQVRDELHRVLRRGGTCAVVLGESKRFPGMAQEIIADFGSIMPLVWGPTQRITSRRRVSDRAVGEPVEFVSVFRKQ